MALTSIDDIQNQLHASLNGRFTIRGRNGAGKSTLLALLKEGWGNDAFLLPTNYLDLKFKNSFLNESDGNRLLNVLDQVIQLDEVRYVLLDEWDANLDAQNSEKIHRAIDQLSKRKVVIETRHR